MFSARLDVLVYATIPALKITALLGGTAPVSEVVVKSFFQVFIYFKEIQSMWKPIYTAGSWKLCATLWLSV